MNRGKMATFYMTYENNREWNAKVFRGIIEAAGRDHIIISDPSTGMRYLCLRLTWIMSRSTAESITNIRSTASRSPIHDADNRNDSYEDIDYERFTYDDSNARNN